MNVLKHSEVVRRSLAYGIAVVVVMLGAVVFTGWIFHINAWVDFTGQITMKTNTALAFFLSGLSLTLLIVQNPSPSRRWAGRVCAMMVLLLGALSLSEHLMGWNLRIDQLFASEPPGLPGIMSPNRMGPPASICFTLAGLAFLLLSLKAGRERIVSWLATVICLIALLPTIGYFYGVQELYGIARYTEIAPITAVAFLFLGVGLLCSRPGVGFMPLIFADDAGGSIVRRLILPALFLPLILGYVRLMGERQGLYDAEMGTALVMVVLILTYLALLWFNGSRISSSAAAERATQAELKQSEERFRLMVSSVKDYAILMLSPDGEVLSWNEGAERLKGYPAEEIVGRNFSCFYTRTDIECQKPQKELQMAREQGSFQEEGWRVRKDGSRFWAEVIITRLGDSKRELRGFSKVAHDITERKRAEQALRESEARQKVAKAVEVERQRLNEVLNMLPAYVILLSPDYRVPFANRFFEERFGKSNGKRCYDYLFNRTEPCEVCETFKVLKTNAPLRWEWTGPDDRNYDIHDFPFTDVDGSPLIMEVGIDITEIKKAQAALKQANESLERRVAERTAKLRESNEELEQEVNDRQRAEENVQRHNSVLQGITRIFQEALSSGTDEDLGCLCLSVAEEISGSKFGFIDEIGADGLLHILAISDPGWEACKVKDPTGHRPPSSGMMIRGLYGRVMQDGKGFFTNDPVSHPDWIGLPEGHPPLTAFLGVPLIGDGRVIGMISVGNRDGGYRPEDLESLEALAPAIVEAFARKRAEAALLASKEELARANDALELKVQERTAQLQKMVDELEHFSYTITHDMRAPLRAMEGFGAMLLEECADCLHSGRREFLKRIVGASSRMDSLITDALNYSKVMRHELDLEPVDAKALLQGMVETYSQFQPPKAEVTIEGEIPVVMGNVAGLTQCFSNLLGNAVKFVHPDTVPKVRVWAEKRGEYARIWFEDNGIGIAKHHQEQIFIMFQKLDKSYEGTGIGLALVRKVVERMKGKVGVESEEGKGSRFWVELKTCS